MRQDSSQGIACQEGDVRKVDLNSKKGIEGAPGKGIE